MSDARELGLYGYCGGLNEGRSHSLRHRNTWFPVGVAVQGSLGGVALLE